MRILLDTHAFVWFVSDFKRLSDRALTAMKDPGNELLLSTASAWEIAIKATVGKMNVATPVHAFIPKHLAANRILPLPVELSHAMRTADLPLHHRDPFDRLLIAQAQVERIPIISADRQFAKYDVEVLW
ncbi:MAG: type II toxin-antitoxin system VapC family toxin [Phycisphaerae bacterium]|nr:type II toxin-antitoxin system VapC family toxin [Phycisphaerae bacterium]